MLSANTMPRSNDASLEQGEGRFHGVGMNVAIHIDFRLVLNRLMTICECQILHNRGIGIEFIGHNDIHIGAHRVLNELCQRAGLHILSMEEAEIAATLPDAYYDLFFAVPKARLALVSMLFRPNVSFVHFDSTVHQGAFYLFHGSTNTMAEIPSRFVTHPDCTLDLIRGNSLAGLAQKQRNHEPLCEGQVRVIKDSPNGNGELIIAIRTPEQFYVGGKADNLASLATRTFRAIRPAQPFEQFAALIIGRKQFSEIREIHSAYSI